MLFRSLSLLYVQLVGIQESLHLLLVVLGGLLFFLMKTEHCEVRHEGCSLKLFDLLLCDYIREAVFSFVDLSL